MEEVKITHLTTEKRNPKTLSLDEMSINEFLTVMNEEDATVAANIKKVIPEIETAVRAIIKSLNQGGRLIYVGSGTSGRLGVLDAVECPPTFGTTNEVIGIIAGGDKAFVKAIEGAEDSIDNGKLDIEKVNVTSVDVVVGLAASGRTPHTKGALIKAKELGATTVSIACNLDSEVGKLADIAIDLDLGPEVITGSTRLKSGTAQKLVLNMLSTASMVGIGKTYSNLMVDLKPTNLKLIERSKRIVMEACGCDYDVAQNVLEITQYRPKVAIVMILLDCTLEEAEARLESGHGFIKNAIK